MRFGIREKKTVLGSFTSERCGTCKKSIEFRMEKAVWYAVVLGVNLIPLRARYESVCARCGTAAPVKNRIARRLARKHFAGRQLIQQLWMAVRLLIAVSVVAAAVALPLTIRIPVSRDVETLKALVSADGDYAIKDGSDQMLAIVHVENGVKTLLWYDKLSVLTGTGSRGGKFYLHETYQEAADSAGNTILIRNIDDPGRLLDQYNSIIRLYYYDEAADALGFYQGVETLSDIQYKPGKVVYPNINFDEDGEKQQYVTVLYILSNAQVRAQFMESAQGGSFNRLVAVSIDAIRGGRVTDQSYYYLDDEAISLAAQAGLTQDSEAQDFADFIEANGISATITTHYEYFGNTGVVASETDTAPDENGDMQTSTTAFNITEKNGYYIFPIPRSKGGIMPKSGAGKSPRKIPKRRIWIGAAVLLMALAALSAALINAGWCGTQRSIRMAARIWNRCPKRTA